jgi:uncharacterized protein YciI
MQYLVTAYDYTDSEALNRRLENREAHLAGIEQLVLSGNFLSGGAILSNDGKMIGSTAHVTFETRAQLDSWISQDPYILGKVWDKVDIQEVLFFPVDKIKNG